jgi:hypothetical protein
VGHEIEALSSSNRRTDRRCGVLISEPVGIKTSRPGLSYLCVSEMSRMKTAPGQRRKLYAVLRRSGEKKSIHPNPIYHVVADAAIRDEGWKSRKRTKAQLGLTQLGPCVQRIALFSRYLSRQTRLFPVYLSSTAPPYRVPPSLRSASYTPFLPPVYCAHKGPVDFTTEYTQHRLHRKLDCNQYTRPLVHAHLRARVRTHVYMHISRSYRDWKEPLIVPERSEQQTQT